MYRSRVASVVVAAGVAASALLATAALFGRRPYVPPPRKANPATGPNLLLVTLDTTRADRLSCYGNDLIATPRLDALASSGVRFDSAFCPIPETDPSHAAMLTGLEPARHGLLKNGWRLPERHDTLAEILSAVGYTTYAAVSVDHLGIAGGFHQGFDVFDADFEEHQRSGSETLAVVRTWLDDVASRPFFLWVHWFDAHRDQGNKPPRYHPPADLLPDRATEDRYAARGLPAEIARYDAQLRCVDRLFGELLDALAERGALRNTVVAVIADHGESLDELLERFEYGYSHGQYLYDHQVRVPFLLAGPGVPAGRVVDSQVRVFDLLPTTLAVLGLADRVPAGVDGVNLLPIVRGEAASDLPVFMRSALWSRFKNVHDFAIREGTRKHILSDEIGPEYFDLSMRPLEARNLLAGGPAPVDLPSMRLRLEEWSRRFDAVTEQVIDPRRLDALRALGYVEPLPEKRE